MKWIALLVFLTMAMLVHADAISFSFSMDKNDTVTLDYATKQPGGVSSFQASEGAYTVALVDEQNRTLSQMGFPGEFYIQSDPIQEVDTVPVAGRLKYYSTVRALVVRHGSREIFRRAIGSPEDLACDFNGVCERDEDTFSCPSDCKANQDKICTPFKDGICDKGCQKGLDPDCQGGIPPVCIAVVILAGIVLVPLALWKFKKEGGKGKSESGLPGAPGPLGEKPGKQMPER